MGDEHERVPRGAPSNNGSPRVTIAFPFSKIEIREPDAMTVELANLVCHLAEQVAELSRDLGPERADAADELLGQTRELLARMSTR